MLPPWRERLLTALLVVAVAVPVGIVIGGGLDLGGPDEATLDVADEDLAGADTSTSTSSSTSTSVSPTTTSAPSRPVGEVKVRFYNGSRTAGAAVTVGQRLDELGYDVLDPGPSPADLVASTVVAFREGNAGEAAAVARALGLDPSIVTAMPPAPAVSGIGDADVVVIVADELVARASSG